MPWCPNCKTEYQEGYTVCKDCKVELMAELQKELIPFVQSDSKKVADKLVRYLKYSGLDSKLEFNDETEMYQIYIPEDKEKEARKLYQAFIFVERENLAKGNVDEEDSESDEASVMDETATADTPEDNSELSSVDLKAEASDTSNELTNQNDIEDDDNEDDIEGEAKEQAADNDDASEELYEDSLDTTAYVMKADQYKDLAGTVWVFLGLGILGLIFVALNVAEILTLINGLFSNLVMSALFLLFIYIGITTNQKAKKIQAEIDAENQLTNEINQWLELNVTESFLNSIKDPSMSEELNYLKTVATIKEMLVKEFGPQNLSYLDRLIEEFYSRSFD